ncbi:MAG: spore coat protein CotJB [Clostridia bacterium]|nr:spore coat protein CotJB [Clostridia bacterium]
MTEQKILFRQIQLYKFAVHETILYLDGHPCDKKALEFYKKYNCKLSEMKKAYEDKYGPLTSFGNLQGTWKWVECPWPWEIDSL